MNDESGRGDHCHDDPLREELEQLRRRVEAAPEDSDERKTAILDFVAWLRLDTASRGHWAFAEFERAFLARLGLAGEDPVNQRFQIRAWFQFQEVPFAPQERERLDDVIAFLPMYLLRRLAEALEALEDGETTPLLQRAPSTGKGPSWTMWQHRLRACQHVAFLQGRGVREALARARVADHYGAAPATVRWWREQLIKNRGKERELAQARAAGALHSRLEDDPDYGRRDGEVIDAVELHWRDTLSAEPLAQAGQAYRAAQHEGH